MKYATTTVICCAAGIGRTFFTQDATAAKRTTFFSKRMVTIPNSSFTVDIDLCDGDNVTEVAKAVDVLAKSGNYRYVLVPNDYALKAELRKIGLVYLTVCPFVDELNAWVKRWMKADASTETIEKRISGWNANYTQYAGEIPIIYLSADEWLGNILSQTIATDGKDV